MRKLSYLLVELRRRRVFRVAGMYILGAWIALQVADLAFESWNIPSTALRYVWIGTIIGFPIVLVLGWRYDIVDGQVVHVTYGDVSPDLSLGRIDYLVLTALTIVTAATLFGIGAEISAIRPAPQNESVATANIDPRSIAVLPFSDTGRGRNDTDFFAVGIQDDLLTRLSKISALKVISRTSMERYRGTTKNIRRIGKELGVGKILEGGIQRDDDRIRVNIQLIDAVTDEHLWAGTYDGDLSASNIFAIQSEIVEAIVRQLSATLTPGESAQLSTAPTDNLAAYSSYLKGKQRAEIESVESMNDAVAHFKEAIELDPNFVLAHIGLSDAYLTLGANFLGGLPTDESNALAEPPLARAMELNGNMGEAFATLGLLRQQQGNLAAAAQAYDQAIALQPNYARVFRLYGKLRWDEGKHQDALAFAKRALAVDPYSVSANYDIARYYDQLGRFDEAMTRYLRVIEGKPNHAFAYVFVAAIHYLVDGRADESLVWYHKAAENDALSPSLHAVPAMAYLEIGDPGSARTWVDRGIELGPNTFWSLWANVMLNKYLGDDGAALRDARTLLDVYPGDQYAMQILRNADIAASRYEVARSRYARSFRELVEPELPLVNASNYIAAVDLALVLMHLGEHERANDLLEGSLKVIDTVPRHGTDGYWITDVRIFAARQQRRKALDLLRVAVDEGWRVLSWYYLEHDPNLESIRDDPEFLKIRQEIQTDLFAQAERVQQLKASGELALFH